MHIHGNSMNVNAANSYSGRHSGKGRRCPASRPMSAAPVEIRRRPCGTESAEAATLIGHWARREPQPVRRRRRIPRFFTPAKIPDFRLTQTLQSAHSDNSLCTALEI